MPVLTKINTNSIAEDAISGDKLGGSAYLANSTTQNITGTYSENRLYTSDAYTLSGNATVNSNLTLSSVKPNDDVVLTAGGAYTITGTGVLSGGTLLAKANTDASTMSGAFESSVNLGSATFPYSGHIINTVTTHMPIRDYATTAGTSWVNYWSPTYTPLKNNSIVYAWLHLMGMHQHNGNWQPQWSHKYSISGDDITNLTDVDTDYSRGFANASTTDKWTWMDVQHMNLLRPVRLDGTGTGMITYALSFKNDNSAWYSHTLRLFGWTSGTDQKGSSITFQEVTP